jgi:hypothetical protein
VPLPHIGSSSAPPSAWIRPLAAHQHGGGKVLQRRLARSRATRRHRSATEADDDRAAPHHQAMRSRRRHRRRARAVCARITSITVLDWLRGVARMRSASPDTCASTASVRRHDVPGHGSRRRFAHRALVGAANRQRLQHGWPARPQHRALRIAQVALDVDTGHGASRACSPAIIRRSAGTEACRLRRIS